MGAGASSSAASSEPRYAILSVDLNRQVRYGGPGVGFENYHPQPDELVAQVNTALQAGATLVGGMSAIIIENDQHSNWCVMKIRYCQAVVYPPGK